MSPLLFANIPVRNSGWKEQNNMLYDISEVLKGQTALGYRDILCPPVENPGFAKRNFKKINPLWDEKYKKHI